MVLKTELYLHVINTELYLHVINIYINLQSEKNEENAEIFTSNQFSVDDSTYQCSSVNLQKCTKIEKKS